MPCFDAMVWVGKVKSTCAPELLRRAFEKFGDLVKIETGFGGFAFVEFIEPKYAQRAIKSMHNKVIPHVGLICAEKATFNGYMGALEMRSKHWRQRGGAAISDECTHWINKPNSQNRTDSTEQRWRSPERKPKSRKEKKTSRQKKRKRSRSASRSRSVSTSKRRKDNNLLVNDTETNGVAQSIVSNMREAVAEWTAKAMPVTLTNGQAGHAGNGNCEERRLTDGVSQQPRRGDLEPGSLSCADRAAAVQFFNGASAPDIMLEGAGTARAPAELAPDLLRDFPRSFQSTSQDTGVRMLRVLSAFIRSANTLKHARSVEVRQAVVLDAHGRRFLRKSLVIDGTLQCTEERDV
eukprot:TRINITY_DN43574_c0_g1_i1.p1 TRINITY_DN43574_c0_g1~~TRINITY_DN43574_c0_g1_i1.p1  ORF type:complete len:369 (+),score=50.60 TRINITY_DN43574_c0_g1_i1:60-1109(+)